MCQSERWMFDPGLAIVQQLFDNAPRCVASEKLGNSVSDKILPDKPVSPSPEFTVDARGLYCPEPMMLLHRAVRETHAGDRISLLATDPSTRQNMPKFCQFLGHELVSVCEEAQDVIVYHIVRGSRQA